MQKEYIATLNYELNKLMQNELTSGSSNNNAAAYGATTAQATESSFNGYQAAQTGEKMSTPSSDPSGAKGSAVNPVRQSGYMDKQNQVNNQGQSHAKGSGATGTSSSEGSFMQSLLSDQNPMTAYSQSKGHMPGASVYSAANSTMQHGGLQGSAQPNSSQGYAQTTTSQGHTPSAANIQMQQAYQLHQQQQMQHQQQQQRQSRPVSPSTLQEFAAQVQHFDKNALIELLWSQRNSLIQWQRRSSQLEAQLNARYSPAASGMPSPYYNGTPPGAPSYGSSVPQNVSTDAELERANMRRNARIAVQQQQQQQYPAQQPHYVGASTGSPMMSSPGLAGGPLNPVLYWEKVRALKNGFSQELYLAHRVLSQHNAAPNSAQSAKAESVKYNISLAMDVLNEAPSNIQPRPFEVLNSIERFIQNTIIPIVQKVQAGAGGQSSQQPSPAGPPTFQNSPANSATSMNPPHPAGLGGASTPNAAGNFNQVPPAYQVNNAASQPVQAPGKETKNSGSGRGKKVKPEQAGGQKMPPRAKQPAEGKSTTKRMSKAAEAKLAAQQSVQQVARVADGHQSPFGAGASGLEKMQTPTVSPTENRTMSAVEDSAKAMAIDAASKAAAAEDVDDDALNDFSDFPELDFDEEMPSMKVQFNKENNSYNTKKRSIGDV